MEDSIRPIETQGPKLYNPDTRVTKV